MRVDTMAGGCIYNLIAWMKTSMRLAKKNK